MIYVFLANGFEEVEALTPVDVLRRAGKTVCVAGVGSKEIMSSHGITVVCDETAEKLTPSAEVEAVVLPGGMPGTLNLEKSAKVNEFIDYAYNNSKYLCAICAAPSVLGHKNILNGKNATCFPGFEKDLYGAKLSNDYVVKDGNIITAKGMGVSLQFGLKIAEQFVGKEKADSIKSSVQSL